MRAVGVRELKNRLSEYLRAVRRGEHVLVTDRGYVIAQIVPPSHSVDRVSHPRALESLVRDGLVREVRQNDPGNYAPTGLSISPEVFGRIWDDLRDDRL
jgi:prevent-host-death family protein